MAAAVETTLPAVPADAPHGRIAVAVAEVQQMNSDGWGDLPQHAADAGAPVRLEFRFSVGAEESAQDLAEYFVTAADYVAAAIPPPTDVDSWGVRAQTPEVSVTEAGLTEWVHRLVGAGYAHGDAELDGWAFVLA